MLSWASRARHLIRRLLHREQVERELDEEVRAYFDTMIERRMSQGITREDAQRWARLELEGSDRVKENVREARTGAAIETTLLDVRYACRVLRKNPGFAAVAVLSLGLGLGANTAIFTLVNTILLKSLPVRNPDRLYFVDNSGGKEGGGSGPPYPCYERLRDRNHYFAGMAAFSAERFKVMIDGLQEQVRGQYASGSYFDVLGVDAILGRALTPADDSVIGSGGQDGPVAVISYRLWDRRFGRSPAVLGKTIQVGTSWPKIVGVTPPGFDGLSVGSPVDVTIPMMLTANNLRSKKSWWFSVIGRLKDGASPEQARAELDGHFQAYMEEVGITGEGRKFFSGISVVPAAKGLGGVRRRFSKPLLIVMTIVGLVLLIGCANVANLLLARASARRKEIALRLAIGASRGRLVRQLFTEGLVLAGAAALVGILFARWGVAVLVSLFAGIRGRIVLEPQFDWRVAAFTMAAALLTGLLFSIAPALHAIRTDAAKPAGDARTGTSAIPSSAGNLLVIAQIMLSVVLLCGAALFLRSLRNLTHVDAGFQREGVLTMQVDATLPKSAPKEGKAAELEHAEIGRMWERVLEPLQALPQAGAASVSTLSPMSGHQRGILMDVSGEPRRPERERGISINQVSASYFDAFGVTPLAGRVFTPGDQANSPRVAILNEIAARRAFPDSNPVGRRVNFPGQRVTAEYQVVGIVRDTRYADLRKAAEPMIYVPISQAIDPLPGITLAIRTRRQTAELLSVVRRRVREIVPGGFLTNIATVQQQVDESLLEDRLVSILASLFGGLALLLAAVGLYGMMSFTVLRRTREIGIRIAVGAQRRSVLWLILRDTFRLAGIGLALGIPLVFVAKKYIESELFGIEGGDPVAIACATLLLASVALASGFWPAWRASRLDPTISLRQE
jgi:predicted permease